MRRLYIIVIFVIHSLLVQAQLYEGLDSVCDTIKYNMESYIRQEYAELFIVVGNTKDQYFGVKQLLNDGTEPPKGYITKDTRPIELTRGEATSLFNIIDNAFSPTQIGYIVDEHEIIVHINISSATGIPTGVSFTYYIGSGYENIPMSVWQNIERRIIKEFSFAISEIGKTLNHNSLIWSQCPKGRVEALPEEEAEEDDANSENVQTNIGTININKGAPTTNRGTMTPIGGFGKGATTTP